jgi:hypothetical protein
MEAKMRSRILVAMVATALVAVGCGGLNGKDGGGTVGSGDTIQHPTGADQLVLRWEYQGGFVAYEYTLTRIPSFSSYGDGTLITEGPQPEIYPGPAMPNLLSTPLTEDGTQTILGAAEDAGLTSGDAAYPFPCIADAATTVFTVDAGGAVSTVAAYALGEGQTDCRNVDSNARAKLAGFQAKLGDLQSWLPAGAIGSEQPYEPTQVRLYVGPFVTDPNLTQEPIDWPLDTRLADLGAPLAGQTSDQQLRCGVVSGPELATLLPDLQKANQLTPWRSDGSDFRLLVRPLLPDEHGC